MKVETMNHAIEKTTSVDGKEMKETVNLGYELPDIDFAEGYIKVYEINTPGSSIEYIKLTNEIKEIEDEAKASEELFMFDLAKSLLESGTKEEDAIQFIMKTKYASGMHTTRQISLKKKLTLFKQSPYVISAKVNIDMICKIKEVKDKIPKVEIELPGCLITTPISQAELEILIMECAATREKSREKNSIQTFIKSHIELMKTQQAMSISQAVKGQHTR